MHLIDVDDAPKNEHRFFVDDQDEGISFDPAKKFNTHESLLNRKSNRLTLDQLDNLKIPEWVDDAYLKVIGSRFSGMLTSLTNAYLLGLQGYRKGSS